MRFSKFRKRQREKLAAGREAIEKKKEREARCQKHCPVHCPDVPCSEVVPTNDFDVSSSTGEYKNFP